MCQLSFTLHSLQLASIQTHTIFFSTCLFLCPFNWIFSHITHSMKKKILLVIVDEENTEWKTFFFLLNIEWDGKKQIKILNYTKKLVRMFSLFTQQKQQKASKKKERLCGNKYLLKKFNISALQSWKIKNTVK